MEQKKRQHVDIQSIIKDGDIFDPVTKHILREVRGKVKELKYCPICKKWHTLDRFYPNKGSKSDGLNTYCKECSNKKSREYYKLIHGPVVQEETETGKGGNQVESRPGGPCMSARNINLKKGMLPGDRFDSYTGHIFRVIDGVETELKHCPCCDEWKPVSEFQRNNGKRDGYQGRCAECQNKATRAWKANKKATIEEAPDTKAEEETAPAFNIKDILLDKQISVGFIFEVLAEKTNGRFNFFAYDKELGMTIPIKTKEETQAYVMGA